MNGTATIPIARTNAFDSSGTEIIPIAFLSGSPFPGSVIPESRIDPVALTALAAMPSPNVPTAGTSTGAFQTTTSVQPGATVEIDGQNNSGFASFAGWLAIPYAPYLNERTTTLELFIDGNLVATLEVPYNTSDGFISLLRMVIRKRRTLVLLRRILAQLVHQNRDGLFKLRIVTLTHRLWILLHLDIGRDPEIFNFP